MQNNVWVSCAVTVLLQGTSQKTVKLPQDVKQLHVILFFKSIRHNKLSMHQYSSNTSSHIVLNWKKLNIT